MAPRKKATHTWPFGRKFTLWLADHALSLNSFAHNHGIPQSNLQAWTKQGRRIPADAIAKIALATKLPAGYWLADNVPYPPPMEYEGLEERLRAALHTLSPVELRRAVSM